MWVAPDDLYVLAAQNAIGDRNSVKLGGLTDTLLGYSFFKISLILCGTTVIHCAKHVPLKNGHAPNSGHFVVRTLTGKDNANAASKTFKPIVQYYYVVLCEFESEHKWIIGAVPTTWQFLTQVLSIR